MLYYKKYRWISVLLAMNFLYKSLMKQGLLRLFFFAARIEVDAKRVQGTVGA